MRENENPGRGQRPGSERGLADKTGHSITLPPASVNKDLWEAIDKARAELGLLIRKPVADGRLHRCPVEGGRPGNLDGAYRICLDRPANLWAMNHKTGAKETFLTGGSSNLSPAERREFAAKAEADRRRREADQLKAWDQAAQRAKRIYAAALACNGHEYLTRKGVQPHYRLRVSGAALAVPLYDACGDMRTLQFISQDGQKRFQKGGRKAGCFLPLEPEAGRRGPLLICEGLATGLSLLQATGLKTLVSFDAGNLQAVAQSARRTWPGREIVICADNDAGAAVNVGVVKAREAAQAIGGKLAVPFLSGGPGAVGVDFNDLAQAEGPEAVRASISMASEPGKGAGHGE